MAVAAKGFAAGGQDGRANHDYVGERLGVSEWITVPPPMGPELRAPDSIQFNLKGMDEAEARAFAKAAEGLGAKRGESGTGREKGG